MRSILDFFCSLDINDFIVFFQIFCLVLCPAFLTGEIIQWFLPGVHAILWLVFIFLGIAQYYAFRTKRAIEELKRQNEELINELSVIKRNFSI